MADLDEGEGEENEGSGSGGGFRPELLQSYLLFAKRAWKYHRGLSIALLVAGLGVTVALVKFLPRTYTCKTVMMVQSSSVLDGRNGTTSFAGAENVILSHDNLESMVRETGLVKTADERRPPLLRLKDRISAAIFGKMDDKIKMASLVGTLESKIKVTTEKGDLMIDVSWTDPATTAELAEAARQSFLKSRHQAEISAFEDKMTILDGHASQLRDDIGVLAQQLKAIRDERIAKGLEARKATAASSAGADESAAPVARPSARRTAGFDAQVPVLKEKLAAMKAKRAGLEAERERHIHEEQLKYDDLTLRLTPSHPQVVLQKERIALASQVPSDLALLDAEVKDLAGEIQQREAMEQQGVEVGAGGAARRRATAELPPDVADLLERDNLDPALSAQLSGAVMTYGSLRNELFTTRVDLDTAQAAFNHRYQVIVPAEAPRKAEKPMIPLVVGGGLFVTLLLSLLAPILLELRAGVIRERWQVEHIQLPVLAELRLPPHSSD